MDVARGHGGHRNLNVQWPSYLKQIRYAELELDLCNPTAGQDDLVAEAGHMQLSHALYNLYQLLRKRSRLRALHVQLESWDPLELSNEHFQKLLSPIRALCGNIEVVVLQSRNVPEELVQNLKHNTAGFRKSQVVESGSRSRSKAARQADKSIAPS